MDLLKIIWREIIILYVVIEVTIAVVIGGVVKEEIGCGAGLIYMGRWRRDWGSIGIRKYEGESMWVIFGRVFYEEYSYVM